MPSIVFTDPHIVIDTCVEVGGQIVGFVEPLDDFIIVKFRLHKNGVLYYEV